MRLGAGDPRLARSLGVTVALVAAPVVAWILRRPELLSSCPLRSLTGLPCPTCGTSRSLAALGRGDLATAVSASPLAVLATLLVGVWALVSLLMTFVPSARRRLELAPGERRAVIWIAVGLVAANWLWLGFRY